MDTFEKRLEKLPSSIVKKIGQIDELKGHWISGAKLNPQVLGRLKKSVLVTSAGASTRIEGAVLSDEDVEKFVRGIGLQKFSSRDKAEVKGYYELLSNIFDNWRTLRLSESSIKHFHKELLKYTEKDQRHRGEYKISDNAVEVKDPSGNTIAVIFKPTPAYLTPKEMQELVEWTTTELKKKTYHPLLLIANFVVEFLNIHPFMDGNGRLSRILTNLLLLKEGYNYVPYVSHEKIIEDNKPDYYLALRKSQKTIKSGEENIAPWFEFFLDIFNTQSKAAIKLLSDENIEKLFSPAQIKVWQYLQGVDQASPMQISEGTNVPRPTINQVLDKLLKLKRVERIGLGRATRYKKL
ncbi:MAG: Fic family protein [Patescibacteria group bacterium]